MFTDRIDLAFTKMALREPFIAAVMSRIKREVSDAIPTAATDGTRILFNETWCERWNDEKLFGLSLHEALHIILMHPWRREGRDAKLWNIANDAIINFYIKSRGYELPEGGVHIGWVNETHDSEYVYRKLKEEQQQQQQQQQQQSGGQGDGDGDGDGQDQSQGGGQGGGQGQDAGGFDGNGDLLDAPDEATLADLEVTIATAAKMAKDCGQGSALIDRILGDLGKSSVYWFDVLRSVMTDSSAADYSYRTPSRRFIGSGLYMPALRTDALGGLGIAFDTSGSVTDKEAAQQAAEIQAIADDLQPEFVEVVYCDSKVTKVERFERGEQIKLSPKGGGGTRFKPALEYFENSDDRYCALIYFTDMEGDLNECEEPSVPMIWADVGKRHPKPPFGIHVEVKL